MKLLTTIMISLLFLHSITSVNNDALACFISQIYPIEFQKSVFFKIDSLMRASSEDRILSSKTHLTHEIQHQIQTVLTHFDSLSPILQNNIASCDLNLGSTLARCENAHGKDNCEAINSVTFARKCPDFFVRHNQFFCYPNCPKGFKELGSRCLKPEIKISGFFASYTDCTASGNTVCKKELNGLYLADCGENHERLLSFACIPKCPIEFLETTRNCHKNERIEVGEIFIFNIQDLIFL